MAVSTSRVRALSLAQHYYRASIEMRALRMLAQTVGPRLCGRTRALLFCVLQVLEVVDVANFGKSNVRSERR